ncbi:site-specific integrase [Nocardia sp. FBN12]|uniref:site-specific integrase n=1 Tax=Nocardia sp. FBN12 TaxID=3419766 RepID=UPI003D022860
MTKLIRRVPNGAPSCTFDKTKKVYRARQKNPTGGPRLEATSTDYSQALDKLRVMYNRALSGLSPTGERGSVEEWMRTWLTDIVARRSAPKTVSSYKSVINHHIIELIGDIQLRRLTVDDLDNMYDAIVIRVREGSSGRYDGISTSRLAHRIMHASLRDALKRERVDRSVAEIATPPKALPSNRRAMTATQAMNLLRTAYDSQSDFTVVLAVLLFTGVRMGESLGLTWDRVDLPTNAEGTNGTVDVTWQLQSFHKLHGCGDEHPDNGWPCRKIRGFRCPDGYFDFRPDYKVHHLVDSLFLSRPKSSASIRKLPLTPQLAAFLTVQARKTRGVPGNRHNLVFFDPRYEEARPIPPRYGWQMFKDAVIAAGLPRDLVVHETRHTTVTLLTEAGVHPQTIQKICGHATLGTTDIYTHVDHEIASAALNKLDEMMNLGLPGPTVLKLSA